MRAKKGAIGENIYIDDTTDCVEEYCKLAVLSMRMQSRD
ncbi:unnamed protein product [Anisakis simplex]|uniref:Uncharacterized protein n=1 Tax=Anisakis simplex TaxID=6269 RepID=A0A3P6R8G1_ANISI|nr:unnamed protein product [Anisakis simplex]